MSGFAGPLSLFLVYGLDLYLLSSTVSTGWVVSHNAMTLAGRTKIFGDAVTFRDSTLNTANLCPAISVVGLFYLFTVMFTFVVDIESMA